MEQKKGKNICRPITFINDYMPISGKRRERDEFCAFGVVDGIRVDNPLPLDDTKNSITNQIWEDQEKFNKGLEGKYNAQRVYIVRWEEEEAERSFWEGNERPFFFFCRVQCDGDKMLFMRDRTSWEGSLQSNEIAIKTYLTYDNTDLFIVIRASQYSKGAEVINQLHRNQGFAEQGENTCILKNSFTVMAVRYSWIKQVIASDMQKWNQDIIENVYIRLIEREGGDIGNIERQIKIKINNCQRWPVLGTDDEMIVLTKVGWGDFLSLYNEENGIFGDRFGEDSVYNINAAGVTTQLCVQLDNLGKKPFFSQKDDNEEKKKNEIKSIFDCKVESLNKKLEKIKKSPYGFNELNIILNALPKYSGEMFNDYVFFPLLKILDTLLDLMLQRIKLGLKKQERESFYIFLTGFIFYTQHTILTDRHTAQTMGFNVRIYDIPVKLNALYNALLYRLVPVLKGTSQKKGQNGDDVDYDFIAMPGMADFVKVVELFKDVSDRKRLIKVVIPESGFYDVRKMMTILSHEVAHYAGREMRSRNARTDAVIFSYVHVYIEYIEKIQSLAGYEKEIWQENKTRLINMIYKAIYIEIRKRERKEGKTYKDNIDYFMKLRPQLYSVIVDIIDRELSTVFAPLLWKEKDKKQELLAKIQEASWKFIVASTINKSTAVSSEVCFEALMNLYEESFADLMSILILQIGVEEYITGIIEYAEGQEMSFETLKETDACLRISVVLGCILGFDTSDSENELKGEFLSESPVRGMWLQELEELGDEESGEMAPWQIMVQTALWLWYRNTCEVAEKKFENTIYSALLYDNYVLERAAEYLKLCMMKFVENQNDKEFEENINKIRGLFRRFEKKEGCSGEDQILAAMEFIEAYRRDLFTI